MTRKRIQVSFAHAQPITTVQRASVPQFAGVAFIIDVDLTGETFRFSRSRRRKEADCAGLPSAPPPYVGGYKSGRKRLLSVRADSHTISIFYRHVL